MPVAKDFDKELILLGKRLKQLRKHRGHTLLDLEVLSGINDSDISRYENGKEKIELFTLFRLAKALKVSLLQLVDYNGELPNDGENANDSKKKS